MPDIKKTIVILFHLIFILNLLVEFMLETKTGIEIYLLFNLSFNYFNLEMPKIIYKT